MQESEIEALLAQARQEGRFDSSGSFTVLLRQAQNHAGKDFSRLYPGGYLLKAVQCAVAAGCQDIRIECLPSRATVQMLGPGPARVGGRLLEALRSPLSFSKQDPLGHLAICILAALAQGASRVEWCCFDGQHGEILAVTQETVDLQPLQPRHWKIKGKTGFSLHIHRDAARLTSEKHMLQSRCGYCPASLTLNSKQLRGSAWLEHRASPEKPLWYKGYAEAGFRLAERFLYGQKAGAILGLPAVDPTRYGLIGSGSLRAGWAPRAGKVFLGLELPTQRAPSGAIALPIEMNGKSRVIWVQQGVCLQTEFHDLGFPGALAVQEAADLGTDFTGLKVVEDERHKQALETLRDAVAATLNSYRAVASRLSPCPSYNPAQNRLRIGLGLVVGLAGLATGALTTAGLGAVHVLGALSEVESPEAASQRARRFHEELDGQLRRGQYP